MPATAKSLRMTSAAGAPRSYREAMNGPDREHWRAAIKKELDAIESNGVWEGANLPRGTIALDSKWLFRIKYDPSSKQKTWKARLVLRGFRQREGVDYDPEKIFAPTAR